MQEVPKRRSWSLRPLPRNSEVGWTPYAWLIYLPIIFVEPYFRDSWWEWTLTAAVAVVFLALYFRGHWVEGRRLLPVIFAITAIGALMTPFNAGATVFFIYAAGFLGRIGAPARGVRYLLALLALLAFEVWLFEVPWRSAVPGLVFSALIGGVNIHFAEVSRRGARLRLAQVEVERLAKQAERERIARDLHDLLGHTLSVITLKAELATKLAQRDPERAEGEMREVEEISRRALKEVRRAVQGFRMQQLGPELARARVALETAGIELDLATGPYELDGPAESAASLALREAVTNVVRHSGARRCRVEVRADALRVLDDGLGRGEAVEGGGLRGLRERVAASGGALRVDAAPEGGTDLEVRW